MTFRCILTAVTPQSDKTSRETAKGIKERINKCNKFILVATNGAIDSRRCNWELGFADAQKFNKHIALFPMKPKREFDWEYKGNEYMMIYPYIVYSDGGKTYWNWKPIQKGYFVRTEHKEKNASIKSLKN